MSRLRESNTALMEARADHTTPGKSISSIATMMIAVTRAHKLKKIGDLATQKSLEAIMKQYLKTMKEDTWDKLRHEFVSGDEKNTLMSRYLTRKQSSIPNYMNDREVELLCSNWVAAMRQGGFEFALHMAMKPGMRRLKPKSETIELYDKAKLATDDPKGLEPGMSLEDGLKNLYVAQANSIAKKMSETVMITSGDIQAMMVKTMTDEEKDSFTASGRSLNSEAQSIHSRLISSIQKMVMDNVEALIVSKKW